MARVQIVSSTWARDSHDLFDFEAHHLHTKTFTIDNSSKLVRSGTEVQVCPDQQHPPPGADTLLRTVKKDGQFWLDKASSSSSSKKLWLVVRDLPSGGSRLSEGDVIKLGRFKFRVRQLVSTSMGGLRPELRLGDGNQSTICVADVNAERSNKVCRICLMEGGGDDDHLIAPCTCKGSIEYVHLECLRHWIRSRLNISESSGGSYFYRSQCCELCKTEYPTYVHVASDQVPLVEVPHTEPPFIVLENMVRDSQQHSGRGLHVISLAENKLLKLGRGHESDVRIADVSISRCHATIRFHNNGFVLEDHQSKFGTLVAMKKPRMLENDSSVAIQVGRTVLSLKLQSGSNQSAEGNAQILQSLSTSNAQDERACRLSLLFRNAARESEGGGTASGATEDARHAEGDAGEDQRL
jgi:hypothetical protein